MFRYVTCPKCGFSGDTDNDFSHKLCDEFICRHCQYRFDREDVEDIDMDEDWDEYEDEDEEEEETIG